MGLGWGYPVAAGGGVGRIGVWETYVFHSDYHGQGYATEACRALLGHAFGPLQAQRVVTGTAAANTASRRLLERLGFRKTSESTGSFRNDADGRPITFLGYAYELTREEWG